MLTAAKKKSPWISTAMSYALKHYFKNRGIFSVRRLALRGSSEKSEYKGKAENDFPAKASSLRAKVSVGSTTTSPQINCPVSNFCRILTMVC